MLKVLFWKLCGHFVDTLVDTCVRGAVVVLWKTRIPVLTHSWLFPPYGITHGTGAYLHSANCADNTPSDRFFDELRVVLNVYC